MDERKPKDNLERLDPLTPCVVSTLPLNKMEVVVAKNARALLLDADSNNEETCLLSTIHRLAQLDPPIENKFKALESLYDSSDGMFTEYLVTVAANQYRDKFEEVYAYLSKNNESSWRNAVVEGLSVELAVSDEDKDSALAKDLSRFSDKGHKEFIVDIFNDVDPSKYE